MCGIAGIVSYHPVAQAICVPELQRIRDHMTARGPDGKGEWVSSDGKTGFGHRRLSIIDLSDRGAQPMVSNHGKHVITFNGEIYNYLELRRTLEAKGRVFHSDSDTEVLLQLYDDQGVAMLSQLRGMFAFAIWDADKQATLLARDPYGIKPLYYADDGWTLRFASQVKALLAGGKISSAPEPAGIIGFYLLGSVPEPFTVYQEIRALPAGSYLWVDTLGASAPTSYFSMADIWQEAENHAPINPHDLQEKVRQALFDSVNHHLIADVPVGAFLSAGIDSSAIVGVMSEMQKNISTLTLSFSEYQGKANDEGPLAAQVAALYGTHHVQRSVGKQEFFDDLPKILQAMDQPSTDGINTWFISKATHEAGLKVAISGLGGDELFGGYPSFKDIPRWRRNLFLPSKIPGLGRFSEMAFAAFQPLAAGLNPKAASMLRYGGDITGGYLLRRGLFMPHELNQLFDSDFVRLGLERLKFFPRMEKLLRPANPASKKLSAAYGQIALLESSMYMRNQLLRDSDWASMAHSLEVRVPLVDSVMLKTLAGPLAAASVGNRKQLLAKSPVKKLPDEILGRSKTGFTTPIANWQQDLDDQKQWQSKKILRQPACPWARRWAYKVLPV